jgi:hypothetical protein
MKGRPAGRPYMEAQIEQFARELAALIARYSLTLAQVSQALAILVIEMEKTMQEKRNKK